MSVIFWISLALLAYVCVGYPMLVWGATARSLRAGAWPPHSTSVSVVMAAHNEERAIVAKIDNLLECGALEVLVGSDGSTDGTVEVLSQMRDPRVRVFLFPERHGKPFVVNHLVAKASGDIVVLCDVRQQFDRDTLRALVAPFADARVGSVSGELILRRDPSSSVAGDGVGAYWRYEKFIRSRESMIDSTIGATGAVYAIRKSLFTPIPADTILDDVLIPLRIVRQGFRVVFEPAARAYDAVPATGGEEFTRKVRTLAGNFQLFVREPWLLDPRQNRLWWQTVSHKVLRLFLPLLQLSLLASNLVLAQRSHAFQVILAGQVLFYIGALTGLLLQRSHRKFWPLTVPFTFCLLSWATVVGFLRCVTGSQTVTWQKAVR